MEKVHKFPDLMLQMIKIGEESGMLIDMLNKTADFFEADIDQFILQFGQLLEPLIMIVLGVLIGGLVISMYLPIFKLGSVL
jgi:type IV pilus assembly protein PilC